MANGKIDLSVEGLCTCLIKSDEVACHDQSMDIIIGALQGSTPHPWAKDGK